MIFCGLSSLGNKHQAINQWTRVALVFPAALCMTGSGRARWGMVDGRVGRREGGGRAGPLSMSGAFIQAQSLNRTIVNGKSTRGVPHLQLSVRGLDILRNELAGSLMTPRYALAQRGCWYDGVHGVSRRWCLLSKRSDFQR